MSFTSASGTAYVCNGAAGPQGATGAQGAAGAAGAPGATGPQGPAGQLSAVMCPTGQYLRGIDSSGAAVCASAGDVAAPSTLALRLGNSAGAYGAAFGANEWETMPGVAIPFISAGGPVQIIPNVSLFGGGNSTCRPLIDGQPAGLFDGENTANIWQDGVLNTASFWGMWSAGRAYPNVPPGRHLVTLQCKEDSTSATTQTQSAAITTVAVIPYGDPATAEVKAATASSITGQSVPCCGFTAITGLTTTFQHQGGPLRISLSVPVIGSSGGHATCRPVIDGAPVGPEPVDSSYVWNDGLVFAQGWAMWNRTRVYDPSSFSAPLSVGTHTAGVQCRTDTGTLSVGTGVSSANLTVVTYPPAASAGTTVHAYSSSSTAPTNIPAASWTTLGGLSKSFSSNGGPVEIGLSLPISGAAGLTATCRPLVDGQPITAGEPDDWSQVWNGGLQGVGPTAGPWQMWTQVRLYRGITAGSHSVTAQCRGDTGTMQVSNGSMVSSLFVVAYDK